MNVHDKALAELAASMLACDGVTGRVRAFWQSMHDNVQLRAFRRMFGM
jgi:hypothetical protein